MEDQGISKTLTYQLPDLLSLRVSPVNQRWLLTVRKCLQATDRKFLPYQCAEMENVFPLESRGRRERQTSSEHPPWFRALPFLRDFPSHPCPGMGSYSQPAQTVTHIPGFLFINSVWTQCQCLPPAREQLFPKAWGTPSCLLSPGLLPIISKNKHQLVAAWI